MKDYRLSEIKAICEKQTRCIGCEFFIPLNDAPAIVVAGIPIARICKITARPPKLWQIEENEDDETRDN